MDFKRKKSLTYSIKEGSGAALMSGAGDSFITPYALSLNANNAQIGFLSSFVGLIGASFQIIGSKIMYHFSRKKMIITFVIVQALMWIPITILGILHYFEKLNSFIAINLLILFYCLYAISGAVISPAWFSLMGDLVEENKRGKYFSKRNKITGTVGMIVTFTASFFLDKMESLGLLIVGFTVLFSIASIGRFISAYYFTKHYYPKLDMPEKDYFGFFQFIKKASDNNFGKFTFYVGLINLTASFASPFFSVYMLKDLGYSYIWFTMVNLAGSVFTIMSLPVWGKIGDKYGNRQLLVIGSILTPLVPFLWLFSPNPLFIIFTAQLLAGLGWSAFNFGASNFIYDSVTPQKRALCIAYFNMVTGIGIFIGAFLGGLFAQFVSIPKISVFFLVFMVSGILRGLTALLFLSKIKEVKSIPKNQKSITLGEFINLFIPKPMHELFRGVKINLPFYYNFYRN